MRRLKKVLADVGLTQAALARKAGIDAATVSRLVNGRMPAYAGWARRLADALGWAGNPAELFEEVD